MTFSVVWSAQARNQFISTLVQIAKEDPLSAELVRKRVDKSLLLLCDSPVMGIQSPTIGVRTYVVPKTGHNFDYRVVGDQIRVQTKKPLTVQSPNTQTPSPAPKPGRRGCGRRR